MYAHNRAYANLSHNPQPQPGQGSRSLIVKAGVTPITTQKRKGVYMTDKTRVVAIRLPNEVAEWKESTGRPRKFLEGIYEERHLNLAEFYKACDAKQMDYQMVIDRMVQLINE